MKNIIIVLMFFSSICSAQDINKNELTELTNYITNFNYKEVAEMKINIEAMIELIKEGKAEVIDIRFKEEYETWSFDFIKSIPLNELPNRLNELDKEKIIITVCPHSTRSALAKYYLSLNGYKSKFLSDGFVGLAEYLRGSKAKKFYDSIK
jgi:rhodanese-related sulfurtransferase